MNRRPTPLDNEQCRSCSSFSDYVKQTKKKQDKNGNTVVGTPVSDNLRHNESEEDGNKLRRSDCPLDKDELGNKSWGFLHTMAARYPEKPTQSQKCDMNTFFNVFAKFYPCQHCAEDLREELKVDPPNVDSQEELSQWLCRLHNKVNIKVGKEVFDCSKVKERWRDGWLDGSCD
ncbi:FAD-linked sulfhydryl oxidase ALR [Euwallacea similis]|uniref:FAD-linked sulfhydryl oxidase ALR n=1 Tax=Euwallacea similis TaxID=1736056 RepID=UPI00344B105A